MADFAAVNNVLITAKDETGPGFESVKAKLVSLGQLASNTGGVMQAAFAAIGVGAFASIITGAIEMEAELYRVAQRAGTTVEAMSAMRSAAKYAGIDMEQVAVGLSRFALNITTAASGTGKVADALNRLGFNAKTFASQFATTDQAILAVSQKLNQYQDGLGKTAIAQALLGRAGAALIPFMKELAERGLDNVKVTSAQARAAFELEQSWVKLKAQVTAIAVAIANYLVPVLQAVADGMKTFKDIAIAAAVAFVAFPIALNVASGALVAYREAAIGAALANEVLGMSATKTGILLAGAIRVPPEFLAGWASALRALGLLFFAAFAGFKIGEWMSANFLEARLAGIAFMEGILIIWENIKLGAQVAWEGIKLAFNLAVEQMTVRLGQFLSLTAKGLSHIPFLDETAAELQRFADSLTSASGTAFTNFNKRVAELGAANAAAKKEIHSTADAMVDYEIAHKKVAALPTIKPPLPAGGGAAADVKDLAKALDAYNKAIAEVAKAGADALAKIQEQGIKNAEADLERSYSRGLVDFKEYWDKRIALANAGFDIEETRLRDQLTAQQQLVDGIQAAINKLDPSKFKTLALYQEALTKAETDSAKAVKDLVTISGALVVVQEKRTQVGKDLIELMIRESNGQLASIKSLDDEIQKQGYLIEELGLTASAIQLVIVARNEELLAKERSGRADSDVIKFLEMEIARRKELSGVLAKGEDLKAQLDLIKQGTDALASGLVDIAKRGGVGLKDMWERFKQWGLEAIAKIAAQKIVLSIVGSVSPGLASAAGGSFSGGIDYLSLLSKGANYLFGGGAAATGALGAGFGEAAGLGALGEGFGALGASTATAATGVAAFVSSTAIAAGATEAFAATLAAAVPVVGWIAAAAIIAYAIFSKPGGGPKIGGSATTGDVTALTALGTGNAGAGRFFTPNEADKQLTEAVQTLQTTYATALRSLGGTGSAGFALGYDTDPEGTAQSRVSAGVTVGGQQVYQQQNLDVGRSDEELKAALALEAQRAVLAALQASDLPADIAKLFSSIDVGTMSAEQITAIEKTAATYAMINNAIASLPSDVQEHFTAMLDGTQELANGILLVVGMIRNFGGSVDGLAAKFEALDPASITAFVDALGGVEAAFKSMGFLFDNFLTSAQKMTMATDTLVADFDALGVAIPETHQQFLDLLNSFDLTTDAGRALYASVIALSGLFVQVHGTADAAAGAIDNLSGALSDAARSAQEFFNTNFYSDAEKQAKQYAADLKLVNDAQATLNVQIPHTVAGFRQLIESIDQTTPAGQALYAALIVLAPAIFNLAGAATQAAAAINAAANSIGVGLDTASTAAEKFVAKFTGMVNDLANASTGDLGAKLGIKIELFTDQIAKLQAKYEAQLIASGGFVDIVAHQLAEEIASLTTTNHKMIEQLALFTTLKAQYGAGIAEQLIQLTEWYDQQRKALGNNVAALAILQTIYEGKWTDIINGTNAGVDGTIAALQRIRDYLDSLKLGSLSVLSPQQKLTEASKQFADELALAQGGDATALNHITQSADAYLQLARQYFASGGQYTDIYTAVTQALQGLLPTGGGFTDVAIPGSATPPGTTVPPSTPVSGKGGKDLATDDTMLATNELLRKVLAKMADLSTAERAAIVGTSEESTTEIVKAVKDAATTIIGGSTDQKKL
jgi:hypothetical protein